MDKLLHCAHCGDTRIPRTQSNGIGDYWLECFGCGCGTGLHEDIELAAKAWNRRASQPGSACHIWSGYRDKHGYGLAKIPISNKTVFAHRLAYCKHHGIELSEIDGLVIRHKCDNPGCVNPEHLETGTHADNMRDMVMRRAAARGEHNAHSKLTAEKVAEIRKLYVHGSKEFGQRPLARKYGVGPMTICNIVTGKTWQCVAALAAPSAGNGEAKGDGK